MFIDKRGVILTNAHIAQYFLLENYGTEHFLDCLIRTGSPATPHYHAKLLYIPPVWVREHQGEINQQSPVGTGENDFGLLYVTLPAGPSLVMPETFPALLIGFINTPKAVGAPVLISAFPAGFLGGITIQTNLFLSSAIASIQDVLTFKGGGVDVLSLGGTITAQRGSSGGAVVDASGKLVGIVVTSSTEATTDKRDLHAITLSHIERSLWQESATSLESLLTGDFVARAEEFNRDVAPALQSLLAHTIDKAR